MILREPGTAREDAKRPPRRTPVPFLVFLYQLNRIMRKTPTRIGVKEARRIRFLLKLFALFYVTEAACKEVSRAAAILQKKRRRSSKTSTT